MSPKPEAGGSTSLTFWLSVVLTDRQTRSMPVLCFVKPCFRFWAAVDNLDLIPTLAAP